MAGPDLPSFHGIIGRSAAMQALFRRIQRVAPIDVRVGRDHAPPAASPPRSAPPVIPAGEPGGETKWGIARLDEVGDLPPDAEVTKPTMSALQGNSLIAGGVAAEPLSWTAATPSSH